MTRFDDCLATLGLCTTRSNTVRHASGLIAPETSGLLLSLSSFLLNSLPKDGTFFSETPSNPTARYSDARTTSPVANSGAGLIPKEESLNARLETSFFHG